MKSLSGVVAGCLVVAGIASSPAVAAQTPPLAPAEEIGIFESVCLEGQAKFDPASLSEVTFSEIPTSVWDMVANLREISYHRSPENEDRLFEQGVSTWDVNATIYRLENSDGAYLVVPAQNTARGEFRDLCAVAWNREDYLAARRAVIGTTGEETVATPRESARESVYSYKHLETHDLMVSASTDWTVMAVALADLPSTSTE